MSYIKRKPDGEFGFRFFEGSFLHSLLKKRISPKIRL